MVRRLGATRARAPARERSTTLGSPAGFEGSCTVTIGAKDEGLLGFAGSIGAISTAKSLLDWTGSLSFRQRYEGLSEWLGGCQPTVFNPVLRVTGAVDFIGNVQTARQALGLVELIGSCQGTVGPSGGFTNGFAQRAEVIVPASSVQFTGTQNMVMYLIEQQVQFRSTANVGGVLSVPGGWPDVQFEIGDRTVVGATITVLPHMPLLHDPATGDIVLAVRAPISADANVSIWCYIGNPLAVAPAANATFADFQQVIDPRTGRDLSPNGRHLLGGTADPDGIVVAQDLRPWVNTGTRTFPALPARNFTRPNECYTITANTTLTTYDFRGISSPAVLGGTATPAAIHHHTVVGTGANHQTIVNFTINVADSCIFGLKAYGDQDVDECSWFEAKAAAGQVNTATTPNETGRDFDDDTFHINGTVTTTLTIAGSWSRGEEDVFNPDTDFPNGSGNPARTQINGITGYHQYCLDDFTEADGASGAAGTGQRVHLTDQLLDNGHGIVSHGGTGSVFIADNCLFHCGRNPYTTGIGGLGAQARGGSKFQIRYPLGMRTIPTTDPLSAGDQGTVFGMACSKPFKHQGNNGTLTMRNCVVRVDSQPLDSPSACDWPVNTAFGPGNWTGWVTSYVNVFFCWLGDTPYPGALPPSGVTLIGVTAATPAADIPRVRQQALDFWNAKRDLWFAAHGIGQTTPVNDRDIASDAPWLSPTGDLTPITVTGFPAARFPNGLPGATFDGGAGHYLQAAPWATWGGWAGITYDVWVQAAAGSPGTNMGVFCEGPLDGPGSDQSLALYWRSTNTQGDIARPLFGNVRAATAATPSVISTGYTITGPGFQTTDQQWLGLRWANATPAAAPEVLRSGDPLPPGTSAAAVEDVAAGTVTREPGTEKLGYGPSRLTGTPTFQAVPWHGLIGLSRLRSARVANGFLDTEFANQNDPKSFYGFGGWDRPIDTNHAPIAVPSPRFNVNARPGTTTIDVMGAARGQDIDRDTGAVLTLAAVQAADQPPTGQGTIQRNAGNDRIIFTPDGAYTGETFFFYTVSDGAKTSRGKVLINVPVPTLQAELPPVVRSIWSNAGFTAGLNNAQLTSVLALGAAATAWPAGVFVSGAQTPTRLQAGDHVMLAAANFNTARTITTTGVVYRAIAAAMATGDAPHSANRNTPTTTQAGRCCQQVRWTLRGQDNMIYGLLFIGSAAKVHLAGLRNIVRRCEFTGWANEAGAGRTSIACSPGVDAAGDQNGQIDYCTFHQFAEWRSSDSNDPAVDPLSAITAWDDGNVPPNNRDRFAVRHADGHPATGHHGLQVRRCLFRDLQDKPNPANYGSGQTDPIEIGNDVQEAMGDGSTTVTFFANGDINALTDWEDYRTHITDCVILRSHEFEGASSAALFDIKMSGTVVRRVAFRGCDDTARMDIRGGLNDILEDIDLNNMSMWVSGFGHTLRRIRGDQITINGGNIECANPDPTGTFQCANTITISHITETTGGNGLRIGHNPTNSPNNFAGRFHARHVAITNVTRNPTIDGDGWVDAATVATTLGTPTAPQNLPDTSTDATIAAAVGCTATWVGLAND